MKISKLKFGKNRNFQSFNLMQNGNYHFAQNYQIKDLNKDHDLGRSLKIQRFYGKSFSKKSTSLYNFITN